MDAFIGEIRAFPYSYVPEGWNACDGSALQIASNQALYSVIGMNYGGSIQQGYFNLPNLQGQVAVGVDQNDHQFSVVGSKLGSERETLTTAQIPYHSHSIKGMLHSSALNNSITNQPSSSVFLTNANSKPSSGTPLVIRTYSSGPITVKGATQMASTTIGPIGGGGAHENRQPYLTLLYCICLFGEYPKRP